MAWGTIRKATETDVTTLQAKATQFVARHSLPNYGDDPISTCSDLAFANYGEAEWEAQSRKRLARLWKAIVRRALSEPGADGIAYGYVGYSVD